jgi:hypothetical protein
MPFALLLLVVACGEDGSSDTPSDTGTDAGGDISPDLSGGDAAVDADGPDSSTDTGADAVSDVGADTTDGTSSDADDIAEDVDPDSQIDAVADVVADVADVGADTTEDTAADADPVVCEYLDLNIYIVDCAGGSQYLRQFVDIAGNPADACPDYWVPGDSFIDYDTAEDALAADNCDLDCLRAASTSVSALRCDRRTGWITFRDAEDDCADVYEFADGFFESVEAWCDTQGTCLTPPTIGDVCGEGPPEGSGA